MATDSQLPTLPSQREQEQAKAVQRQLALLKDTERHHLRLQAPGGDETLELPGAVIELLSRILGEMADGNAVTLVPIHAELTTSQAADLLNISRPHFIKVLESGAIRFTKVGSHRRIKAEDVLKYREERVARRREALTELTTEAERLGLGY
jgi:excisionase family DNA binding protein